MPETIEKTVFAYSELSETAKERARAWWLEGYEGEADWIMGEAKEAAEMLGISIDERGKDLAIYWRAGRCQSDGASFAGSYSYAKGALAKIRADRPTDEKLQQIARDLQEAQRCAFWALRATIKSPSATNIKTWVTDTRRKYEEPLPEAEDVVCQAMRDFSQWIYRLALDTHDFQTSEEAIAESMAANEYRFDEHGRIQ